MVIPEYTTQSSTTTTITKRVHTSSMCIGDDADELQIQN